MNNISGGHSNINIKYEDLHIKDIQHNQKKKLFLINDFVEENAYVTKYFEELDNLLVVKDGKINVDFLNNYYANMYVDFRDTDLINEPLHQSLEIIKENDKYIFKNNDKYEISETIAQGIGSGSIILKLKKKVSYIGSDKEMIPDELILKAFPYEISKDKFSLPAYLSLEIFHITNKTMGLVDGYQFQNNYSYMDSKIYESINKNIETSFNNLKIKTKSHNELNNLDIGNDKLFLACKNDNFHNEIIVNLIMQKIHLNNIKNNVNLGIDNFIQYKQFYFSTIQNKVYGFLVMDYMNGSADKLLNGINKGTEEDENKYKNEIDKILNDINKTLTIFKTHENLFTHTDMKLENIFYKNINKDNTDFIKYFIADFDKSSITYNGIRFYNDINKTSPNFLITSGILGGTTQNISIKNLIFKTDGSTFSFNRSVTTTIDFSIPTEALALRYVAWPFYIAFDYQSLLLSLCALLPLHYKSHYDSTNSTNKFKIYFKKKYDALIKLLFKSNLAVFTNIMEIYTEYKWPLGNYGGDFSKLLFPLMVQPVQPSNLTFGILNTEELENFFLKNTQTQIDTIQLDPIQANPPIRKNTNNITNIILLSRENKLILGLPFYPNDIIVSTGLIFSGSRIWNINLDFTKNLYLENSGSDIDINKIMIFFSNSERINESDHNNNKYKIYYNGNQTPPPVVVLTNRYSSSGLLYEYDIVDKAKIYYIFKIYEDILFDKTDNIYSTSKTIIDSVDVFDGGMKYYNKYMKYKIKYKNIKNKIF